MTFWEYIISGIVIGVAVGLIVRCHKEIWKFITNRIFLCWLNIITIIILIMFMAITTIDKHDTLPEIYIILIAILGAFGIIPTMILLLKYWDEEWKLDNEEQTKLAKSKKTKKTKRTRAQLQKRNLEIN